MCDKEGCRFHFVCPRCGPHPRVGDDLSTCLTCGSPVVWEGVERREGERRAQPAANPEVM